MTVINLQRTMNVMATKMSELDKLANQNKELTRLLVYFETFFGVLYSEVSSRNAVSVFYSVSYLLIT